jgi:hypothetical protein
MGGMNTKTKGNYPAKVAGTDNKLNRIQLLTSKEVAGILRISIRTLQTYRDQGVVPFFQMGRVILYKPEDIQEFIDQYYNKPRFWNSEEGGGE